MVVGILYLGIPKSALWKNCNYGGYLPELGLLEGFGSMKMPCPVATQEPWKSRVGLEITSGFRGKLVPC